MAKGIHILFVGALSLVFGALQPTDALSDDGIDAVRQAVLSYRGQGEIPLSAAADMMVMMLRRVDGDGNGLDQGDLDFALKRAGAQLRAGFASDRLRYDLDGDARVSRVEVETVVAREPGYIGSSASSQQLMRERADEIMRDDADGDGFVSGVELVSVPASRKRDRSDDQLLLLARAFLAADPDHDGLVTQAESFAIIAKVLSPPGQEPAVEVQKGVLEKPAMAMGSCPPLQFDKDSDIVLLGAYEGKAVSNVSVVGQDDVTSAATIQIEPGPTPITLILTSYDAIIWEITGETSRIAKVVATSANSNQTGNPGVGIVGVESEKVEFVIPRECFRYFYDPRGPGALTTKAQVERVAGREVAAMIGRYGIGVTSVPSGEDKSPPAPSAAEDLKSTVPAFVSSPVGVTEQQIPLSELANGSRDTFLEFRRFSPGGLKAFRVETVTSASKPEYYEVLPQQAGLLQLLQSGALTFLSNDQGGSDLNFRIQSPTRFPPGLYGAHSVKFFLPKGIPMPKGNPGHSCVFLEQDASYSGATCR